MMAMAPTGQRLGVLALARPTFDVPYAEEMAARAFARLDEAGIVTVGPRNLLFDAEAARQAAAALVGLAAPPAAPSWRAAGFPFGVQRAAGEAATAHGTHGPHQPCPALTSVLATSAG